MRIREIVFYNFRGFRGRHQISFVNSVTDEVRQFSVLAGSNGTGKTTILEAIEALIGLMMHINLTPFLEEIISTGSFVSLAIELSSEDIATLYDSNTLPEVDDHHLIHLFAGPRTQAPSYITDGKSQFIAYFIDNLSLPNGTSIPQVRSNTKIVGNLSRSIQWSEILKQTSNFRSGLIYFPYNRQLGDAQGGAIESPAQKQSWVERYTSPKVGKVAWNSFGSGKTIWTWSGVR